MSTYRDELHVGVYGCLGGLLAGEGPDEAGGVAHGVVALGVGADPVPAATLVHVAVSADQEAGDRSQRHTHYQRRLRGRYLIEA